MKTTVRLASGALLLCLAASGHAMPIEHRFETRVDATAFGLGADEALSITFAIDEEALADLGTPAAGRRDTTHVGGEVTTSLGAFSTAQLGRVRVADAFRPALVLQGESSDPFDFVSFKGTSGPVADDRVLFGTHLIRHSSFTLYDHSLDAVDATLSLPASLDPASFSFFSAVVVLRDSSCRFSCSDDVYRFRGSAADAGGTFSINGVAVNAAAPANAVPEPPSVALLLCGGLALCGKVRRGRRRKGDPATT